MPTHPRIFADLLTSDGSVQGLLRANCECSSREVRLLAGRRTQRATSSLESRKPAIGMTKLARKELERVESRKCIVYLKMKMKNEDIY
jgi:hypothetical protein